MPLQLPPGSRFCRGSPETALPMAVVNEFENLIGLIAAQVDRRQDILEHFKSAFCSVIGVPNWHSSDESWAQTDLSRHMGQVAETPELFLGAFYDACEELRANDALEIPPISLMNQVLRENDVPFEFNPPRLIIRQSTAQVAHPDPPPSLGDSATALVTASFRSADELLSERRPREAVQEMLWILESVTTVFRGVELPTGTVQGRYFNEIARELRASGHGKTLERVRRVVLELARLSFVAHRRRRAAWAGPQGGHAYQRRRGALVLQPDPVSRHVLDGRARSLAQIDPTSALGRFGSKADKALALRWSPRISQRHGPTEHRSARLAIPSVHNEVPMPLELEPLLGFGFSQRRLQEGSDDGLS
jgi:hypothetical protein